MCVCLFHSQWEQVFITRMASQGSSSFSQCFYHAFLFPHLCSRTAGLILKRTTLGHDSGWITTPYHFFHTDSCIASTMTVKATRGRPKGYTTGLCHCSKLLCMFNSFLASLHHLNAVGLLSNLCWLGWVCCSPLLRIILAWVPLLLCMALDCGEENQVILQLSLSTHIWRVLWSQWCPTTPSWLSPGITLWPLWWSECLSQTILQAHLFVQ